MADRCRRRHCFLVIAAAAAACTAPDPEKISTRAAPVLQGAYDSGDGAVVALTNADGAVICTGTLISSRVVLTAGHCTYGFAPAFAYFGTSTPFRPGDLIRVDRALPHPDYTPNDFRHADVGVVILRARSLAEPRPWNAQPLDDTIVGHDIRIVGFGFQQPEGVDDRRIGDKMSVHLSILQLIEPKEYEYLLGTCNGDSGGPQFFTFPDGVERVIGVTSYGRGGCTGNSGAHRVDFYDSWIRQQIAAFDPPSCQHDFRCVSGCPTVDPDCPCAPDDGGCSALCNDPASDPQCPLGCGGGDFCLHACPAPDPDCGDPCVAESHCIQDCPTRDPDCPAPVGLGAACSSDFDCADGSLCLTAAPGEDSICTPTCERGRGGCGAGLECRPVDPGLAACLPPFDLVQAVGSPSGCSVAVGAARGRPAWAGALVVLWASLIMVRRRRRNG